MNNKYGDKRMKLGNQFTAKYLHILLKETVYKTHNRVDDFYFDLIWEHYTPGRTYLSHWCQHLVVCQGSQVLKYSNSLVLQKWKLRSGVITWVGGRATVLLEEIPLSYRHKEWVKTISHMSVYLHSLSHLHSKLGRQLFTKAHIKISEYLNMFDIYLRETREKKFHCIYTHHLCTKNMRAC